MNSPQGGPPPPPHLCARMLGDCHALKACICRTALVKAHGAGKKHCLTKGAQKTSNIFEKSVQNRAPGPPTSSPGASEIEPGALQDAIFEDIELKKEKKGSTSLRISRFGANLAPSWKPKSCQNRGRNPKISTLKNDAFLTSILKGVRLRFGGVFGRFFQRQFVEKCKNALLTKTLKIVIFPREN